jgi:hypothetical protein
MELGELDPAPLSLAETLRTREESVGGDVSEMGRRCELSTLILRWLMKFLNASPKISAGFHFRLFLPTLSQPFVFLLACCAVDRGYDGEGMTLLGGRLELQDSSRRHDELMTTNDAHLAFICDGWVAEGV